MRNMEKVKVINLTGNNKWLNLLHCLNNSVPHIFAIQCKDETEAKYTAHWMQNVITGHQTWFPMVIIRRGSEVYVIKTQFSQKVVVHRE